MKRSTRVSLLLTILTACHGGPSREARPDSPPTWSADEDLRIGSYDTPGATFTDVGSALLGPDGEIAVADRRERLVRMFDRNGRPIGVLGGPGDGPGEFPSNLSGLGRRGDTVFVADQQGRFALFLPDGTVLDSRQIHLLGSTSPAPFSPWAWLPGHDMIGAQGIAADSDPMVPLLRVSPSGEIRDTVVVRDLRTVSLRLSDSGRTFVAQHPFPEYPLILLDHNGLGVVMVQRSRPLKDGIASFPVDWITPSGDTTAHQDVSYVATAFPPDAADAVMDTLVDRLGHWTGGRESAEKLASELVEVPGYCMPVSEGVVSDSGDVWLRRDCSGDLAAEWWVVSSTAGLIGEVTLPAEVSLRDVRGEAALGTLKDDLGVPFVARFRILRVSPPAGAH